MGLRGNKPEETPHINELTACRKTARGALSSALGSDDKILFEIGRCIYGEERSGSD
jgi:hypothetical protein